MDTEENGMYAKRGFLEANFALFHLKDKKDITFEVHFHEFNKLILFKSGDVTYLIEGKAYNLRPNDILLVNSNEIHQPIIRTTKVYERIILWFNPQLLSKQNTPDCNLLTCFEKAAKEQQHILRLTPEDFSGLNKLLNELETTDKSRAFGSRLLRDALFLQFIIHLNRTYLGAKTELEAEDVSYDEVIGTLLGFINTHLEEDLSTERLASVCHLSKYHLMRRFKAQTGHTLHGYIIKKRLIAASRLLKEGKSVTQACLSTGFGDYANFIRAFKQTYGLSPKKYYKLVSLTENT